MGGGLEAAGDQVGHGVQGLQGHLGHAILDGKALGRDESLGMRCLLRNRRRHQAIHLLRA